MGNPFYKASNGGFLEGYGKRRVSPKVNSAGKQNERVVQEKVRHESFPNGLPMPVSSELMQRLGI